MNRWPDDIQEAVVAWMLRIGEPDFADWDGFAAWLETSPAHRDAYAALLDRSAWAARHIAGADRIAPVPPMAALPEETRAPARWRGRAWSGGLAAALVALLGWGGWQMLAPRAVTIETRPGTQRLVTLAGTRIQLNGETRLVYDARRPRAVTLARGEALFDVRHDAANPFTLTVGSVELIDRGTRFDVTRGAAGLRVQVAEGVVAVQDAGRAVTLRAGTMLLDPADDGAIELRPVAPAAVGGWRHGQLSYVAAPLATVAADLSRGLGVPILVDAPDADRRFTGSLAYGTDKARFLAELGPTLGMRVRQEGGRWRISGIDGRR
ncbi:FecR family protein [Sphingomonas morindae]|uniref:FecR domain-containing protein n=1 Tax=Sphingomonas morindae TaxID=1541170 RepID=A0ABY4XDR8_9SPHN|nr:FecR domain-containing protein [Sphingomonas morindae]USI74840.1 FecR domain-containing protein [Sphingomonas morindae]